MHELAVTEGILKIALETSQKNGGGRITAIDLVVGELSSIVDDSVQFYFDIQSQGTLAEKALLRFRRDPLSATCLDCHYEFAIQLPLSAVCPNCGGTHLRVHGGREFYIASIEVENEDTGR
jgi:hydrogenase nickel incorporation protein HypA/HybF